MILATAGIIVGSGNITALPYKYGEEWGPVADEANTWVPVPADDNVWTLVPSGSNQWQSRG